MFSCLVAIIQNSVNIYKLVQGNLIAHIIINDKNMDPSFHLEVSDNFFP